MEGAARLLDAIRRELRPVEARIRDHPHVRAAEEGRWDREDLERFVAHQHHIIGSDLRSFALLVHRYGASPSGPFFRDMVTGEAAARDALLALAAALGLSEEVLAEADLLPGALAYATYVAWLAAYGTDTEVAAAFLVNLPAWGANCARLSRALPARLGVRETAFFDLFAEPPEGFAERAQAVVEGGLAAGVDPVAVLRAARLLQGYELLYWDTLHEASGGR